MFDLPWNLPWNKTSDPWKFSVLGRWTFPKTWAAGWVSYRRFGSYGAVLRWGIPVENRDSNRDDILNIVTWLDMCGSLMVQVLGAMRICWILSGFDIDIIGWLWILINCSSLSFGHNYLESNISMDTSGDGFPVFLIFIHFCVSWFIDR